MLANSGGKAPYLLGRLFPSLKVDFDGVEKIESLLVTCGKFWIWK